MFGSQASENTSLQYSRESARGGFEEGEGEGGRDKKSGRKSTPVIAERGNSSSALSPRDDERKLTPNKTRDDTRDLSAWS